MFSLLCTIQTLSGYSFFILVKCPDLQEPPNGGIKMSEPGIQATANFTCLKGFTLDGSSMLSCLTNGSWDGVSPSCSMYFIR